MAHKDVQRRTWDKAEFEARAREREATERAGRTYKTKEELEKEATKANVPVEAINPYDRADMKMYDFKDMVGQRKEVSAENALSEQGGFYCKACDYLLKDQKSYLEHCNKPRHLQRVGLPSEVKRSNLDDIKAKLAQHSSKKKSNATADSVSSAAGKKRTLEPSLSEKKTTKKDAKKTDESKKAKPMSEEEAMAVALGLPLGFATTK